MDGATKPVLTQLFDAYRGDRFNTKNQEREHIQHGRVLGFQLEQWHQLK
jgi:hypothetical protein